MWPVPQLIGIVLLVIAGLNIFPVPEIESAIYRDFLYLLAVGVVFSLLYNGVTYGVAGQFKPVPLAEVYRETEIMAHEVPEAHQAD